MSIHALTHVALRVEQLREAEGFYRRLFALEVAWREAETPDGWATLPASADWDDAERAGFRRGIVMLYRDGFRLALEVADTVDRAGQLSHLGLFVDEQELRRLREIAAAAGCAVVVDREQALIIDDPFGVRWELNTFAYDDPPSMSTGARTGRWLDVGNQTTPATDEEALHRLADAAQDDQAERAARQLSYLQRLSSHIDLAVLASEEMWR
jgi:catechol 2,3-dioxygenase-like lactoylglutathione lyase family enzyme